MSRVVFVDPIGGAAGDMLLAALLDAGASEEAVLSAVEAVLPGRLQISADEVRRAGIRARLLRVTPGAGSVDPEPRRMTDLVWAVDRAFLPERVGSMARSVLERLGAAEARVHGVAPDDLTLHQLGEDDTLLDVVGVAAAIAALDVERLMVGPVPIGAPGPATLELLRGFSVRGGGAEESVTPTAAAILSALGVPAHDVSDMRLEAVGYGAGSRDPADRPNVVRVLLGSTSTPAAAPRTRPLSVVETNVDDLTPELVADSLRDLMTAGALDAWVTPVHMKKGRPGFLISALCEPALEPEMRAALFRATPTFGVRAYTVQRTELERRTVAVPLEGGDVRIKLGILEGEVVSATPEHDDVVALAHQADRPVREVYEEAAAAARHLKYEGAEPS
jgi:uncharacterized protein (TIGR00299 family) protein